MSRKSQQPESAAKGAGGKKGKKDGKGGTPEVSGASRARQAGGSQSAQGAPFPLVLAVGVILSAPTLLGFVMGTTSFEDAATRFLMAMAVSWVLTGMIFYVMDAMHRQALATERERRQAEAAERAPAAAAAQVDASSAYAGAATGQASGF